MIIINFVCTCGFKTESLTDAWRHGMTQWAFPESHKSISAVVDDESLRQHLVFLGTIPPCAEDE